MTIELNQIVPYLSLTLFKIIEPASFDNSKLVSALKKLLRSDGKERQFSDIPTDDYAEDDVAFRIFRYAEKKIPSWFLGHEIKNIDNHLVTVANKGGLLAIIATDPKAVGNIIRATRESEIKGLRQLKLLNQEELEKAFLDDQIRTLWLSGAHQRTPIKPDGKVITGLELESALDPLGDQSYYYSSIRSTSGNDALKTEGRPAVIGMSPRQGKIWIGPTKTWPEFAAKVSVILQQADSRKEGKSPPVLARNETNVDKIEDPYGVAIILPESITNQVEGLEDDERWLQQFGDAARFENIQVRDNKRDFTAVVSWGELELGTIEFEFDFSENAAVKLKVKILSWTDNPDHQSIAHLCTDSDNFTIFFESGHTYARDRIILRRFRDAPFEGWQWVPMASDGTSFDQEKTNNGAKGFVKKIGAEDDKSLFGLVVRHWPNLEQRGAPSGWLICDDGAMESADFIHFDPDPDNPKLSLIHVKGSHSSAKTRQISVADYEVVVGQAVKNLRHIDQGLLAKKLTANANGQLKDAVWFNGKRQKDRAEILKLLQSKTSNLKKEVIVLQPRVRKSDFLKQRSKIDAEKTDDQSDRLFQLDALLLGARAACFGLGTSFKVIGDDDTQ